MLENISEMILDGRNDDDMISKRYRAIFVFACISSNVFKISQSKLSWIIGYTKELYKLQIVICLLSINNKIDDFINISCSNTTNITCWMVSLVSVTSDIADH